MRDDGRLVYVQDAYTATNRFPHGQGFNPSELNTPGVAPTGLGERSFNYLRNSVKIVVDAYDGTMTFYANDPDDALIRAWQGVFPTLFQPMSDFPTDLRPHLRVPEEQFNVQTRVYGRYHVQNADTFYDSADLWTVPISQTSESSLPSEAYYVIMSLPEAVDPEFLLLQPMIPKDRPNMIAWVAARNDGENYGQTLVYRFPTETSVFGPAQIEASIDADPEISAQFTLWSQSGSSVIRGNLIVVPVGDSLIYLQPVYLQATSSKFPAFQKIIVASPTTVVWGDTLRQALDQLLRDQGGGGLGPTPAPSPTRPDPVARPDPTPGSGILAAVRRRRGSRRLRQPPLRARPASTPRRRLCPVRPGDRARRGGPRPARGTCRWVVAGRIGDAERRAVSRGGAILASLLVTLGRPAWWLLALAGFLVRGGFVVFLIPIVVLPSPLAVSNVVAPFIVPMALGRIVPEVIVLSIAGGAASLRVAAHRRLRSRRRRTWP